MKSRTLTTHQWRSLAVLAVLTSLLALGSPVTVAEEGKVIEPEVTVRHAEGHTLYEYRANGLLYLIKVVPENGTAYYLVDPEGMGNYIRMDKSKLLIPSWVLHSW